MLYISRKKYYKLVNEFEYLENSQDIIDAYPCIFKAICCYWFHLPHHTTKSLFVNLGYGNWEHLWETEEEEKETIDELCETLRGEIFYCSDRMSWDRLLRIHWIWQRIQRRKRDEEYTKWEAENHE